MKPCVLQAKWPGGYDWVSPGPSEVRDWSHYMAKVTRCAIRLVDESGLAVREFHPSKGS